MSSKLPSVFVLAVGLVCLAGWNAYLHYRINENQNIPAENGHSLSKRSIDARPIPSGGALYTRWGRTTCPPNTELVYEGVGGGNNYDTHGGGTDLLCLPRDPEWDAYTDNMDGTGKIWGAEFEQNSFFNRENLKTSSFANQDVVCAVCRVKTRSTYMMLPAKRTCPVGWVTEYGGYLMAGHYGHKGQTNWVCMDKAPEVDPDGYRNDNGALLYFVQGECGSLPCPNYVNGRELTCVVCTK